MDRQEMMDQSDQHKNNASIARSQNQLWDALKEEALSVYYRCEADQLRDDERLLQTQLALGFTMIRLRFSTQQQKQAISSIAKWTKDGDPEALSAILEKLRK